MTSRRRIRTANSPHASDFQRHLADALSSFEKATECLAAMTDVRRGRGRKALELIRKVEALIHKLSKWGMDLDGLSAYEPPLNDRRN